MSEIDMLCIMYEQYYNEEKHIWLLFYKKLKKMKWRNFSYNLGRY